MPAGGASQRMVEGDRDLTFRAVDAAWHAIMRPHRGADALVDAGEQDGAGPRPLCDAGAGGGTGQRVDERVADRRAADHRGERVAARDPADEVDFGDAAADGARARVAERVREHPVGRRAAQPRFAFQLILYLHIVLRREIPLFPTSPKFYLIAHSPDKDVAIAPIINCNFIYLLTNH